YAIATTASYTLSLHDALPILNEVIDDEILRVVHYALEKIEEELNLGIQSDQELILGLSLHLKPAINRYKFGMNIRNPMLSDIKRSEEHTSELQSRENLVCRLL